MHVTAISTRRHTKSCVTFQALVLHAIDHLCSTCELRPCQGSQWTIFRDAPLHPVHAKLKKSSSLVSTSSRWFRGRDRRLFQVQTFKFNTSSQAATDCESKSNLVQKTISIAIFQHAESFDPHSRWDGGNGIVRRLYHPCLIRKV